MGQDNRPFRNFLRLENVPRVYLSGAFTLEYFWGWGEERGGMDLRILSVIIRTASLGTEENPVKSSPPLHYLFANIANFNHFLEEK